VAAGQPAWGSITLAIMKMGHTVSWQPGDVELWPGGAERGHRRREKFERRWRQGVGCWYLLTQIEYKGFRKRTEYHCSILPGVFQISLFIFYHKETME
jgi:hypothetical protein